MAVSREARARIDTPGFRILTRPNGLHQARLGVTVTKKVGSAAIRNRIKRHVREFFRLHKHLLPTGRDYLVIAHRRAAESDHYLVHKELMVLLHRPS